MTSISQEWGGQGGVGGRGVSTTQEGVGGEPLAGDPLPRVFKIPNKRPLSQPSSGKSCVDSGMSANFLPSILN